VDSLILNLRTTFLSRLEELNRYEKTEQELREIQERVQQLELISVCVIPVQSLAPEPYGIRKPLQVSISTCHGEFIASFPDAHISASGESFPEALDNFKDVMLTTFQLLSNENTRKLGKIPRRQLAVLREFLQELNDGGYHNEGVGSQNRQEVGR
jgi:predicted RNase H-like HicB family nuclease